ncbi:MAG: hypothetical protein WB755_06440 [Terriglobales bacterium]
MMRVIALVFATLLLANTALLASGPTFVQVKSATPQTASASVALTYTVAQTAGNLNVVVVGWNDTTSTVSMVGDSLGNNYTLANRTDEWDGGETVDLLCCGHQGGQ